MKKRNLGIFGLLMAVLAVGIYIGYYVTAVRYEYIRAYGAGNQALIELDLLNKNLNEKVADLNKGNLVVSFALVDNLPDWSRIFNPSSKDRPKRVERMESYHEMIESLEGHFTMEVYSLTQKDLKRILSAHFGHYEVLKGSQQSIDELNKRLRDSKNGTEGSSEPGKDGNG